MFAAGQQEEIDDLHDLLEEQKSEISRLNRALHNMQAPGMASWLHSKRKQCVMACLAFIDILISELTLYSVLMCCMYYNLVWHHTMKNPEKNAQ